MTDIYVTSFYRKHFTERCLNEIHERTTSGTYQIHIFDNGSDTETRDYLYQLLHDKKITSVHLDSRNTGCVYNKGIFHMMTECDKPYYVVTDNDVFPPKLDPDWLSQMTKIMDEYQNLGMLAMQLPPQSLQMPVIDLANDAFVPCGAVGNTFKMVRRSAFPLDKFDPVIAQFGDDLKVSREMIKRGWVVAFCRHIYCWHAGQCVNWGYSPEQVAEDPRKENYGKPFIYEPLSELTYEPPDELKII